MSISLNGYDVNCITLRKLGEEPVLGPIDIKEQKIASAATSGTNIHAVAVANRGDYVTVQTTGYVELPYSGSAPALGVTKIACNGMGGVSVSTASTDHLIVTVDTKNKKVGFII